MDEKNLCKYSLGYEGREIRMVAACKECGGKSSLKEEECFKKILNSFANEFGVDNVILSHYIQVQYHGGAIELMKKMLQISNELNHLSSREPTTEYAALIKNKGEQVKKCSKCSLYPQSLFLSLREAFITDIVKFYELFQEKVREAGALYASQLPEPCRTCINVTGGDLGFLYNRFESVVKYIIKEGFSIII
ncbi:MAG: hypothetical protein AB1779_11990 [Candidatus Thermoplasmatota archaeon]